MPPFEFGIGDEEFLNEELQRLNNETFSTYKPFTFSAGATHFRILPTYPGARAWFRDVWKHFFMVQQKKQVRICPRGEDQYCPICEVGNTLHEQNTEESVKAASELRPTRRIAVNGIVTAAPPNVEFEQDKVYVIELPTRVHRTILEMDRDVQSGYDDVTGERHAGRGEGLQGFDFRLVKKGTGLRTEYTVLPVPQRKELQSDLAARGIDINSLKLIDLADACKPDAVEELEEIANQLLAESTRGRALAAPVMAPVAMAAPTAVEAPAPRPMKPTLPRPTTGALTGAKPPAGLAVGVTSRIPAPPMPPVEE
jgi:hypothetical protein